MLLLHGSLPTGYEEVLHWRLSDKPIRVIVLQLLAVPLFIVAGLVFLGLALSLGELPTSNRFGLTEMIIAVVGILLTLIGHELIHGVTMRMFGATPQYGVLWKKLMLYATTPGFAYRRNAYLQIALAPLFILSIVSIGGMWMLKGTLWVVIVGLCGALNVGGSIGDIWLALMVLRYPATAYVVDDRDGINIFLPKF